MCLPVIDCTKKTRPMLDLDLDLVYFQGSQCGTVAPQVTEICRLYRALACISIMGLISIMCLNIPANMK